MVRAERVRALFTGIDESIIKRRANDERQGARLKVLIISDYIIIG